MDGAGAINLIFSLNNPCISNYLVFSNIYGMSKFLYD